jgi:hypothetical protein
MRVAVGEKEDVLSEERQGTDERGEEHEERGGED